MSVARVGNRLPRQARFNPGRKHIAGKDVTAKMQRQYEHILESLRDYHRFRTDAKRKSVAAATVRKLAKNPSAISRLFRNLGIGVDDESRAELLSEEFHGRPVRDEIEVEETEIYDEFGAVLGWLDRLQILSEDADYVIPITFRYGPEEDNVLLVSNPEGTNLEFIGGDQDVDWQDVEGARPEGKYLVYVGPVLTVAYFTDKHHLAGPKSQKDGTPYEHEFGEDDGELPHLVFDRRNKKMLLVGGSYEVTAEGIAG